MKKRCFWIGQRREVIITSKRPAGPIPLSVTMFSQASDEKAMLLNRSTPWGYYNIIFLYLKVYWQCLMKVFIFSLTKYIALDLAPYKRDAQGTLHSIVLHLLYKRTPFAQFPYSVEDISFSIPRVIHTFHQVFNNSNSFFSVFFLLLVKVLSHIVPFSTGEPFRVSPNFSGVLPGLYR